MKERGSLLMNVVFRKINTALFICLFFFCAEIFIYGNINEKLLQLINSDGEETAFTKNSDGSFIVFSRKSTDSDNSDLYYMEFKNNQWSKPSPLKEVNSVAQEITPFLSSDGKTLLFASNRPESLKGSGNQPSFDIYMSEKTSSGWSTPVRIFGAVNSSHDEFSPFLQKDKKELIFIRRAEGNKDKASAIIVKNKNDSWEEAETVTFFSKEKIFPYMVARSAFSETYIFSGYKYGASKRQIFAFSPANKKLSLIYGDDEDCISFCEIDKSRFVFSSNKGQSGYDLFIQEITPSKEELSSDIIYDGNKKSKVKKKKSLSQQRNDSVRLTLLWDLYEGDSVKLKILYFAKKKSDKIVKSEEIVSFKTQDVKIKVSEDISRFIVMPTSSDVEEFAYEVRSPLFDRSHTIELKSKRAEKFELHSIYFNFNSSDILIQDIPYLHKLITYLRDNPDKKLIIEGYADTVGTVSGNLAISQRRADAVRDYLCKHGINSDRIKTEGKGTVVSSEIETNQNQRRVDFSFED